MKSFILKKEVNDKDKIIDLIKLNFTNDTFNSILLTNCPQSETICIISNLLLKLNESNSYCLITEDDKTYCEKEISLTVIAECFEEPNSDFLKNYMDIIHDEKNLLEDHFAILLPGGSLRLLFHEHVSNAEISIEYSRETLFNN